MGAPIHVEMVTECQAPVDVAFAYTSDFENVPDWLFGVKKFEPVGSQTYGLGAVFDVTVHMGLPIHTRIEVDDFVEGELMSFKSIKGFKLVSRWQFLAVDETKCKIDAAIDYQLPLGPAGKAMGKVMEPFIRIAMNHINESLAKHIAARVA